jgi:hypothetical protein
MVLYGFSAAGLGRALACQFLTAAVCVFWLLGLGIQPARAEAERIIIELTLYGQTVSSELTAQAESMINDSVNRHFSQSVNSPEVEVVVLGDRYGEIVPISTTSVSRAQWRENPRASAWTRYYSASYALLERHNEEPESTAVASSPNRSVGATSLGLIAQIDAAFDNGSLTGVAAQQYLSYLD